MNDLIRLKKSQVKPAAEVLAKAFHNDPLLAYFYPDVAIRKRRAPHAYRLLLAYGIRYGEAYATSAGLEGIALWIPSQKVDMSVGRAIRSGAFPMVFSLGREAVLRMRYFGEYSGAVHKRHLSVPHWYLQIIGVEPRLQGQGYASRLMRFMLAGLEGNGMPCYLETQNEKNVPIYQHYGFDVAEEFRVPGTEFYNWAMIRAKAAMGG